MDLKLRIILLNPPPGVDFGLQKGSGNNYEPIQIQRSNLQDLHFDLAIEIRGDRQKNSLPGFGGPLVHGPALGKFIYIDIGTAAGQIASPWTRRLKIPLIGITWDIVDQVKADPKSFLETRVPGTAKDGGPNCATVKPFDGWKTEY
jgi:hypothetical protein